MSMMRKLLEAMTKFAGEPEQKPGEQWKGTDKGTPGKKLVGDSIIKDLAKGPTPKTKEEELAEAYANFMEDDIGVEPKRPGRKSDRPAREYTKHGKPSKRYTTVEEGWNTGNDRVSLPDTPHTYWSGTGALQDDYNRLYDALVPSQGKADTVEGEVLRASSKIVYRHFNDGDEFNEASFDQLTPYIGTVTSYDDLAHKAIEFALKANGNYTPNPDWDCLDVMDYGPAEEEYDDEDEEDDWYDEEEVDEGRGDSKGLHKKVTIVKGRDAGKTGYVRQIKTDKLRNRVYLDLDLEDGGQAVVLKQDVRLVKDLAENYTGRETKDGVWRVFKDGQGGSVAGPFKSAEEANAWIKKQNQGVVEARTTWNNDFYVYDPKTKTVKKKFRTHRGAKQYAEANGLKVASAEYYHDTVSKEVDEGIVDKVRGANYKRLAKRSFDKAYDAHQDSIDAPKTPAERRSARAEFNKQYDKGVAREKLAKELGEGWESGPEERTRVERDPDAEYDAMRQEKLDAPYAQKEPEAKGYLVVSLDTRKPVTDKVFPTKGHAMAYIQSNHSKNLAYRAINEHWDQEGYDPRGQNPELALGQKALKGKPVKGKDVANLAQDALTKAFGGTSKDLTSKLSIRKGVAEGIESTDPVEGAVLAAVQELIQQGHTEVAPEVITNMVVAATSQPFLLKDLVDCNNNSPAIQHYVDSINPTKVKFSNEILTVKNEDPMKDKKSAQAGVSSMAARAASRNRLGEGSETPLRDTEDYQAKRSALQQIQMDPDTHKDPQLKAELTRRLGSLNQQYSDLQNKLREFKESRGHKVIATKLGNMDRMNNVQIPTPAERQEQIRLRKEKEAGKKPVKEFAAPGANPATPVTAGAKPAVDPAAVAKAAAATNTLKAATGTTVAPATLDKALDSATQGTATSTDVKALAPIMGVLNKAAEDPKLATQFKTIANQAKLTP